MADFQDEEGVEQFGASKRIVDRESDYSKRRLNRSVAGDASTYAERVKEAQLEREKDNTMKQIAQKRREEAERAAADARLAAAQGDDAGGDERDALPSRHRPSPPPNGPSRRRWSGRTCRWRRTPPPRPKPAATVGTRRRRRVTSADGIVGCDAEIDAGAGGGVGPTPKRTRSRWDETR